jgi:hypothetical protein
MLSIESLHLLFQISIRREPGYLAIPQIVGIWVEFGKTFFNVILNVGCELKIKKTRKKILKDSQKLKYVSLVGGNAFAMAMFYSLFLL